MSASRARLVAILSSRIPLDILTNMLNEYQHIKTQFLLQKFQPSELTGARFCECVLRLLEHLGTNAYTPFGTTLSSETIIRDTQNRTALPDTLRLFIPRLIRVVLDVRNKRDVAHVGGEVSPNHSDALFVVHATDWILTEIVRHFHSCSIDEAKKIVTEINTTKIPIVADVDGFLRVQNTTLDTRSKTLVLLYYKKPEKVSDANLIKWTKYSNASRFKREILGQLDEEALIHYEQGLCALLPKGVGHIEKNIALDMLIP